MSYVRTLKGNLPRVVNITLHGVLTFKKITFPNYSIIHVTYNM